MALACGNRAGDDFDNSQHGVVAAMKSTFAPFLSLLVRTLPPAAASPAAPKQASAAALPPATPHQARPRGIPYCAEPELLDKTGADYLLGVAIPIGDHMKMRLWPSLPRDAPARYLAASLDDMQWDPLSPSLSLSLFLFLFLSLSVSFTLSLSHTYIYIHTRSLSLSPSHSPSLNLFMP